MSAKRRILIVDSSDSARAILFKEISDKAPDLDIIACSSGREAMTAVRRFEFEIITTGLNLPDIDGYQLIEQIRLTPKNKDTAIFVVSGDTNTRLTGADLDDKDAVTAYIDKAEGHGSLVNFILTFLGSHNDMPARILYVDKSATSTAITTAILKKHGIDFHHFKEAADALAFLQQDLRQNDSPYLKKSLISLGILFSREAPHKPAFRESQKPLRYKHWGYTKKRFELSIAIARLSKKVPGSSFLLR